MTDATQATDAKPEVKRKPDFPFAYAIDAEGNAIALDDKGRMTAVPANWTYDYGHLQRSHFADKGHYFEWRIVLEEGRIAKIHANIEELRDQAEEARKGPDPKKKAIKKLQRMAKVAAELRAQLEAEGVDVSELEL